ncbi:MAG: response regulator [Fusicatenibacter sp.]
MYQVMLVDDEKYIRKSIRNRVNWGKCGVSVTGEAQNGKEALELLGVLQPQIVLVDIRMPLMDGLSFIAEAKKRYPNIHYIILSAYSDFEYARQAIRMGVEDYILKPVNPTEVEQLLEKIVHELKEKNLAKQLKEPEAAEELYAQLKGDRVTAMSFWLENCEDAENLISTILRKYFEEKGALVTVYHLKNYSGGDGCIFLMNGDQLEEELLRGAAKTVWEQMADREGVCAISEEEEKSQARRAARKSIAILKRKIFYSGRVILTFRQEAVRTDAERRASEEKKQEMREILNRCHQYAARKEYGKLKIALGNLAEKLVCEDSDVDLLETTVSEITMLMRSIPGILNETMDFNILFHRFSGEDWLLRFRTQEELLNSLQSVMENVFISVNGTENVDVITAIRQYIQDNYAENLSAVEIARKFYLNASYLSSLFKEKTGMNMGAYIEGVRMEKAKLMLRHSNWTVTEIAMQTGYAESNYFSKVFKKYTGLTPRQYRENQD